jgi:hypothetical protein
MTLTLAPAIGAVVFGTYMSTDLARDLYFAWKSKQWPRTQGRVIQWGLDPGATMRVGDDSALIGYEYQAGGVRYTSRRIDFAGRWAGWSARKALFRYTEGATVEVSYDPSEPERAVLEPGMALGNFLRLLFGLTVLGFGLLALFAS